MSQETENKNYCCFCGDEISMNSQACGYCSRKVSYSVIRNPYSCQDISDDDDTVIDEDISSDDKEMNTLVEEDYIYENIKEINATEAMNIISKKKKNISTTMELVELAKYNYKSEVIKILSQNC